MSTSSFSKTSVDAQPDSETWRETFDSVRATPQALIEEARNGRMFILVDDENRENEGDLIIPAQMATPEAINFMARYGRGLICLALSSRRVSQLKLPLMSADNRSRHETAFTISIEAKEGITTGISAPDRARTIAVAIDPQAGSEDLVSPGHIFPLVARDGGVLVRAGHTEAAVDLARLAGLNPAGVICEILNDDGTMARRNDLIFFAQCHNLKIGTIADLIAYRRQYDKLVERLLEIEIDSLYGGSFRLFLYVNRAHYAEHIALVKGDLSASGPVLVRMHALNLLSDLLGDQSNKPIGILHAAMKMIGEAGRGIVVLIRDPTTTSLSDHLELQTAQFEMSKTPPLSNPDLRDYGVGAHILADLGVSEMILLTNTKRVIVGLEGYGLKIVEHRPIPITFD